MGGRARGGARSRDCAQPTTPRRDFALERKLEAAAAAPLEIASLGADVAALAALAGQSLRRDRTAPTPRPPPHWPREDAGCRRAPGAREPRRPRVGRSVLRKRSRASRRRTTSPSACSSRRDELVLDRSPTPSSSDTVAKGDADAWNELVERYSRYVYAIAVARLPPERRGRRRTSSRTCSRGSTRVSTRSATTRRFARGSRSSPGGAVSTRSRARAARRRAEEVFSPEDEHGPRRTWRRRSPCARRSRSSPDTCQDILDRFFARDQSYKTIADELEIPSGTIASRIARCLGRFSERSSREETTESEGSRG